MNHWPKIVSIVVLDTQALLTIGTHIVKKHWIHYDVRWSSRSVGLTLYICFHFPLIANLICLLYTPPPW